jgi:hypothetical protein
MGWPGADITETKYRSSDYGLDRGWEEEHGPQVGSSWGRPPRRPRTMSPNFLLCLGFVVSGLEKVG